MKRVPKALRFGAATFGPAALAPFRPQQRRLRGAALDPPANVDMSRRTQRAHISTHCR